MFVCAFKVFWESHQRCKAHFVSLQRWWDYGKVQIRQLCQEYTHGVTRDRARLVKELETTVVELQRLAVSTGERGCLQSLKAQKSALASLLGTSAQGALVRSRHMDLTQMDVPSQFFFSLEVKNGQKRIIQSLRSDGGRLITSAEVRSFAAGFYEHLYSSELRPGSVMGGRFGDGLPQVSDEDNMKLEAPLTLAELGLCGGESKTRQSSGHRRTFGRFLQGLLGRLGARPSGGLYGQSGERSFAPELQKSSTDFAPKEG
uniref:Uncharacterized protein n=1 Tax=Knipowitschia caucasica TaxID=637954 RepID=A0AAV2J8I0_KNICA